MGWNRSCAQCGMPLALSLVATCISATSVLADGYCVNLRQADCKVVRSNTAAVISVWDDAKRKCVDQADSPGPWAGTARQAYSPKMGPVTSSRNAKAAVPKRVDRLSVLSGRE